MRIVIGEDRPLLRESLVQPMADEGHEVVASAGDGPELLRKAKEHRPDVVVADVRMSPSRRDAGLAETAILVLSHHVEVGDAVELLAGGRERRGLLAQATRRIALSAEPAGVRVGGVVLEFLLFDREWRVPIEDLVFTGAGGALENRRQLAPAGWASLTVSEAAIRLDLDGHRHDASARSRSA